MPEPGTSRLYVEAGAPNDPVFLGIGELPSGKYPDRTFIGDIRARKGEIQYVTEDGRKVASDFRHRTALLLRRVQSMQSTSCAIHARWRCP
jgi:hypothetical protein